MLSKRRRSQDFGQIKPADPLRGDITPQGRKALSAPGNLKFHRLPSSRSRSHQAKLNEEFNSETPHNSLDPTAIVAYRMRANQIPRGICHRGALGLNRNKQFGIQR